jgi:zinc protease
VRTPRFDPAEWQRVQGLEVEALRREQDNPSSVAGLVGMRVLFGDQHPYGRPVRGTPESVAALTCNKPRILPAGLPAGSALTLLVAGDLTADQPIRARAGVRRLEAERPRKSVAALPPIEPKDFRVVLVDKPGAVQTVIRFYLPAPAYQDAGRVPRTLLNTILGGSFTSRLNQNLRERNGFTYGAGSRFLAEPQVGYFVATSNVQAVVTGAALREFLHEFAAIRSGDVSAEARRTTCGPPKP